MREQDYRAALVEIAEAGQARLSAWAAFDGEQVEQMLRNLSAALASRFGLPDEGRALARCARTQEMDFWCFW